MDIDFETIKSWAKKIGSRDPFSAKINDLSETQWLEQVISFAAAKPANEWNDKDFKEAGLAIEEMVRHFIMSYRLYTLRENHSETKIIDIAIFDGKNPERSSKFYNFKNTKNSVTQTLLNHTDVIINHTEINEINLFVRRSFSEDLWLWIKDSARFI